MRWKGGEAILAMSLPCVYDLRIYKIVMALDFGNFLVHIFGTGYGF